MLSPALITHAWESGSIVTGPDRGLITNAEKEASFLVIKLARFHGVVVTATFGKSRPNVMLIHYPVNNLAT